MSLRWGKKWLALSIRMSKRRMGKRERLRTPDGCEERRKREVEDSRRA